jgi:hypothetical protein
MITAEFHGHRITRNASFFKRLNTKDCDDELPTTSQNTEPVKLPVKQPTSDQQPSQSELSAAK